MRRARVIAGALAAVVVACVAGPWMLPEIPADPVGGALLAPGTRVTVLRLTDGRILVSPTVSRLPGDGWRIERGGQTTTVPAAVVQSVASHRFWLGSDRYGRDVLRRLLLGGRLSLAIGGAALLVALLAGITVGLAAATGPRWLDAILMRIVDAWMAFPMLFLLILLVTLFRPGTASLVAILGASSWMGLARLVRGQALALREQPFLQVSRAMGTPWFLRWGLHYLPNLAGPVSQEAALRLGDLIVAEATLSFLGLGVQPPTPSWGAMAAEGQAVLLSGWWIAALPGLAIALVVLLLAAAGDCLQERAHG